MPIYSCAGLFLDPPKRRSKDEAMTEDTQADQGAQETRENGGSKRGRVI